MVGKWTPVMQCFGQNISVAPFLPDLSVRQSAWARSPVRTADLEKPFSISAPSPPKKVRRLRRRMDSANHANTECNSRKTDFLCCSSFSTFCMKACRYSDETRLRCQLVGGRCIKSTRSTAASLLHTPAEEEGGVAILASRWRGGPTT